MSKKPYLLAGGLSALVLGAMLLLPGERTQSADHLDPPSRTSPMQTETPDRAADIADVFAWAEGGNLNMILTFAGPADADSPATYDRDVLYRFNVSTDGDATSTEQMIEARFGQDGSGNNGIQITGLPGAMTISGPVETNLTSGSYRVRAGLFDDPFFFDLQGFLETRDTGELRFSSNRDFFAFQNVTAIVIQAPLDSFDATGPIAVWADTARFGGDS